MNTECSSSAKAPNNEDGHRQLEDGYETVEHASKDLNEVALTRSTRLQGRYHKLSPISTLPDDILREIFAYCRPVGPATFSPLGPPLLFCHVCRAWRTVAFGYSLLWTRLRLEVRKADPGKQVKLRKTFFAEWMSRCKQSNIHLQIVFYILRANVVTPPKPSLFSFLDPYITTPSCNLSRLNLINLPLRYVLSLPDNTFSTLERLVLKFNMDDHRKMRWEGQKPIRAFRHCPSLRRVALAGHCIEDVKRSINLPWRQLTHFLFADRPSEDLFWDILPQMEDLRYALLGIADATSRNLASSLSGQARPVIFGKLTTLVLTFNHDYSGDVAHPDFLWCWEFPNLRTLRLDGGFMEFENAEAWCTATKDAFTQKLNSFKNLQLLSIDMNEAPYSTLRTLFGSVHQLTTLELHLCDQFTNALDALIFTPATKSLPALRTLVLDVGNEGQYEILRMDGLEDEDVVDADSLHEMILSRRNCDPANRLQKVVVYASKPWQIEDHIPFMASLRHFSRQGLELELKCVGEARRDKDSELWSDRDPGIEDWPEVMDLFESQYEGQAPNRYCLRSAAYPEFLLHPPL
ncbi:hypothetical protein BKA70DRAFT_1139479 [Coprinopsis sp. MPI-PUGE-AT-0042]|nr:hypothetical protein BKA70DRAFT_1139479 [Coprinopsis sp. MPI-PUGE-AT-0042]